MREIFILSQDDDDGIPVFVGAYSSQENAQCMADFLRKESPDLKSQIAAQPIDADLSAIAQGLPLWEACLDIEIITGAVVNEHIGKVRIVMASDIGANGELKSDPERPNTHYVYYTSVWSHTKEEASIIARSRWSVMARDIVLDEVKNLKAH